MLGIAPNKICSVNSKKAIVRDTIPKTKEAIPIFNPPFIFNYLSYNLQA